MIVKTRAPLRISFAGGGTDLNEVFEKHGGSVINTTIDKYVYVEVKEGKGVKLNGKTPDKFTQRILDKLNAKNIHITSWYEVPFGRGLGNSSAYSIALAKAIFIYKNNHVSKKEIVKHVYGIENSLGKCGWQDQFACAYGGLNYMNFNSDLTNIIKLDMNKNFKKELEKRLCLVYTGIEHTSSVIQLKKKPLTKNKIDKLKELVINTGICIFACDTTGIRDTLNEGWKLKKDKAITNDKIEKIYKLGFTNGATGGKLLGAGDGGYILFYVEPENMCDFRTKMSQKYEILNFKFTNKGVESWK